VAEGEAAGQVPEAGSLVSRHSGSAGRDAREAQTRRLHEPQMAWRKTMSEDLSTTFNEASYAQLLNQVKSRIREARVRAGLAANRELVALYWEVGKL